MTLLSFDKLSLFERIFNFSDFCHELFIYRDLVLDVPVISVGVPTVVNSATLVYDALAEAGIAEIDDSLCRVLENGKSFFVSPKESDVITHEVAKLLSRSIALAFTGGY